MTDLRFVRDEEAGLIARVFWNRGQRGPVSIGALEEQDRVGVSV